MTVIVRMTMLSSEDIRGLMMRMVMLMVVRISTVLVARISIVYAYLLYSNNYIIIYVSPLKFSFYFFPDCQCYI